MVLKEVQQSDGLLLSLPAKTWMRGVLDLHPAYVEITFSEEDAYNPPATVAHNRLLVVERESMLPFIAYLTDG